MIVIGLTGSVASGKSTVAGWMRETGIAVHDADAAVHSLLAVNGQAVAEIIARFGPDMGASDGGIDRKKLGGYVLKVTLIKLQYIAKYFKKQVVHIAHSLLEVERKYFFFLS